MIHTKICRRKTTYDQFNCRHEQKINQSYGVWQKKQFMGKEHMGSMRTTFLIAKDGEILRIWENVNPEGHAKEVLEEIKN